MFNIAVFIDNLKIGGIQKSIINILNNIDLNRYNVDLYLFDDDIFYKDALPGNVRIIKLKKHNKLFKFINFDICYNLAKKPLFDREYDIAIDFDTYQFNTAYSALKCPSKRKIMWIHNDVVEESKYNFKYSVLHHFMKGKYKYFDEFVGVSEGVIEPFKLKNRVSGKNFCVIPNFVDTDEIFNKSLEEFNDVKIDETKYNLVSTGRLCLQKGYDIFLKKYKDIVSKRKDIHFYLIGDGEDKDKLLKLVREYNLKDYVTFLGKKENPFKYERLMDAFVLTSRYEGQGIAILEAYALGLDIFISRNIEKYNGCDIKASLDIVSDIINANKKETKEFHDLKKYNMNVLNSLISLLENKH